MCYSLGWREYFSLKLSAHHGIRQIRGCAAPETEYKEKSTWWAAVLHCGIRNPNTGGMEGVESGKNDALDASADGGGRGCG